MNFKFQNVDMQILSFLLMFMIAKEDHQDFNLLRTIIPVTHHFFW